MATMAELSEDDLIELSLLRDFEIDELVKAGLLNEDEQLTSPLDKEITFKHDELDLHVMAGPHYRSYQSPGASTTVHWREQLSIRSAQS